MTGAERKAAFQKALQAGDETAIARSLVGANEAERQALYPLAADWDKQNELKLEHFRNNSFLSVSERRTALGAALLGTATLARIKRVKFAPSSSQAKFDILSERKPDWLEDWAGRELSDTNPDWIAVRMLVRAGCLTRPTGHDYISAMVQRLAGNAPELLREDPDLLNHEVWRMFEVEGGQQSSLAATDKYRGRWTEALLECEADGRLSREKLLDASLAALDRDFAQFRAGWYSRFHEELRPSPAERAQHAESYAVLCASRIAPTVSFAVRALAAIDGDSGLDPALVEEWLPRALGCRDKGTAERALVLLANAGKSGADRRARIARAAAIGLSNESLEVQGRVLNLIAAGAPDEVDAIVEPYLDTLAASVKARLRQPPSRPAGAPAVAEAVAGIAPIGSLDELVETLAILLENQGPPESIDRALAGTGTIGVERPANFARLVEPLIRRASKIAASSDRPPLAKALASFTLAWTTGEPQPAVTYPPSSIPEFLLMRLRLHAAAAAARTPVPPLALPCDSAGWIDPRVLVERLKASGIRDLPEGRSAVGIELAAAIARLAIPGREEALVAAAEQRDGAGSILRWALGGPGDLPTGPEEVLAAAEAVRAGSSGGGEFAVTWGAKTWKVDGVVYSHWEPGVTGRSPGWTNMPESLEAPELTRWCATAWPGGRESWAAAGVRWIGDNLDWYSAHWADVVFLQALIPASMPLGPMCHTLVALGLGAKNDEQGLAAADCAIAAFSDGRMSAGDLAAAMIPLIPTVKCGRWAKRLHQISRASPMHGETVFDTLEIVFAPLARAMPRDFSKMLELLHELTHERGRQLTLPQTLAALLDAPLSGKPAKLRAALVRR